MTTMAVLLKESWSAVDERVEEFGRYFYARMFVADPGLRDLFPTEMVGSRSRFISALVAIIHSIDDPERFDQHLRALGRDHRKFHVEPQHYAIVGTALIEALRTVAGERWSIEYDQAWRDAYDAIATRMLSGAEQDSHNPPFWHAQVIAHERRGRDVAVFTCQPLIPYRFRAGQYLSIETPKAPRLWRAYSIANAPRDDGSLDFHVRAPSQGFVSAALVRRTRAGDIVRLGAPMGSMTLNRHSTRDIVCVAGGTGLAPMKALVDEIGRYNRSRRVYLFVGARDRDDLYDLPALTDLAVQHPWLTVVPACSEDPTYDGDRGAIHDILEWYGPWPQHDVYVCGPPPMVRATLSTLARMGVPRSRIAYDAIAGLPEQMPWV